MQPGVRRRSQFLIHLSVLAACGAVSQSQAFGTTTSFTNFGADSKWNTGMNWNHGAPNAGDAAVITSNGSVPSAHTMTIISGSSLTASFGTLSIVDTLTEYDQIAAGTLSTDVATISIGGGTSNGIFLNRPSGSNFDFGIGETRATSGTIFTNIGSGSINITVKGGE